MKTNFEIEENYAVNYKGRHIDLHNNFNFTGIKEGPGQEEIRIEFTKANGDWISKNEFENLTFVLRGISFKFIKVAELEEYPGDKVCLSEITYFPSNLREVNDSFVSQRTPKENDDLIFIFEDGGVIRVNCEEAELIEKG